MRAVLSVLLAFLLLVPCAAALGEEAPAAEPALFSMPLPIDFSGGMMPQEEFYKDDWTYEDPTISVRIKFRDDLEDYMSGYKGKKKAGAWVVDIRLGDASQLRTLAAVSFNKKDSKAVEQMAGWVNAVIAFNGDFAARRTEGLIIRQGETFKNKLKGQLDVLAIDEAGDFHVFTRPKKDEVGDSIDGKKIINAFYFGPVLVDNGVIPEKFTTFRYLHEDDYYARLGICQLGPLHYKMIITTMQDVTVGMKLTDFARLCKDEGAVYAFNLDGGYSAAMIFRGQMVNDEKNAEPRTVPDIIYFASAWNGEDIE